MGGEATHSTKMNRENKKDSVPQVASRTEEEEKTGVLLPVFHLCLHFESSVIFISL